MRLLNTTTYGLVEYAQIKKNDREYVILSHTWLEKHEEEVTYRDMECNLEGLRRGTYKQTGWRKLTDFCKFAANRGHKWAWMDTCCINKADTMETQASIHGMYEFYAEALVCYAYLADVSVEGGRDQYKAKLKRSRWFTRGWTLQELIAPNTLVYLDQEWRHIGTRETFSDIPGLNGSFQRFLQPRITSVASQKSSLAYNLATRMSWAAQRETMQKEDEAYSICGLLQIKLSVRYDDKDTTMAFLRLQLALIEMYHDLSILAWFSNSETRKGYKKRHPSKQLELGILAPSIDFFPKVPRGWDLATTHPRGGIYIDSDCLRVRTTIFKLETAIQPSGVELPTQMLLVELHLHSESSRDKVGIVVVQSHSRKDHYVRKFHELGLFRFNHDKDNTYRGFFGRLGWRWTNQPWYKANWIGIKSISIDYR